MTALTIQPDSAPEEVTLKTVNFDEVQAQLQQRGVRLERWQAKKSLPPSADSDAVLEAYADDVEKLRAEGFITVDVVRLVPDPADPEWPDKARDARAKFLSEHTHDDDEVRFFVEGSGAFYLRIDGEVLSVVCEAGDLISVPAQITHWFDMGTRPYFAAIRFFRNPEGWVGHFTGDTISERFPSYDTLVA